MKTANNFTFNSIKNNWKALFATSNLVSEIGNKLAEKLGYEYPEKLEIDIRKYFNYLRNKQ
ncbi:aminoglycoside 6-adenylyltransferase [Flavobacterium sp. JP2137]|uniref:aminoglycoside 6-adenylyltransferase n=1 Tax=Flavobacterium sp. JP2137 TaxID=3414510 RepID=UPI003D2FB262